MNSHFNSALKQTSSLTRDLALFSNPTTAASPALQGQISASLASLTRTLDDYETLAKRELIPAKKEKAETRLREFRAQLDEFRREFARVREEREAVEHTVARSELLGRRGHSSATPENPYARAAPVPRSNPFAPAGGGAGGGGSGGGASVAASVEEQHFREGDFLSRTDTQLDEFLDRGRAVLQDLTEQRNVLKNTQKRLYSVANTLGVSGNTIRMIERRAKQDKWMFYGGVTVFFVFCYFVIRWLG